MGFEPRVLDVSQPERMRACEGSGNDSEANTMAFVTSHKEETGSPVIFVWLLVGGVSTRPVR